MGHPHWRFLLDYDATFDHDWKAEILAARPLILPRSHFVYPAQVEEVERGALEVLVQPSDTKFPTFLATCALGFAGSQVPTGVWTCPHPSSLCVAAGGYVYLIDTRDPALWQQVEYRPVMEVRPIASHSLLIFAGFQALQAWNREGKSWHTGRLSWDGLRMKEVHGDTLLGFGWDMLSDRELEFEVNLTNGEHRGGGYLR